MLDEGRRGKREPSGVTQPACGHEPELPGRSKDVSRATMSRVWMLVFTLGLVLALGACGGGGGEEGSPAAGTATPSGGTTTPSGKTVEITMWHMEVASNLDAIQKLARRFNDSQSEVKVKLAFQGNAEEEMAKLLASLGGGDLPTIVYLNEENAQRLIDSGAVAPVQDFIDRENYDLSDFAPKVVQYYTVDGKLWAMPFASNVPLLYYDKLAFREVGLDPEKPPKDIEELRQASEKLVKRDSHGNLTRAGLAINLTAWHLSTTLQEHGDLYVNNDNGRAGRATEVLFNGPTGQAYFQWWRDMVKQGLALNVGLDPTGADTYLAVGAGRAAMTTGDSVALRSVVDALEGGLAQIDVDLGVANRPGVPGGTGLPGIYGRALWIFKSRPEAEQEAAWKFIKWLMEPEQQAEWYAGSGFLPANSKAFELPAAKEIEAKYPQFKVAADLYLASSVSPVPPGPLLGPQFDVSQIVRRQIEEMIVGDKDPIDAINDAAEEANEVISDYNRRVE
jgi:sn-glycerol 3-phosphate transport system substrate-binding protein